MALRRVRGDKDLEGLLLHVRDHVDPLASEVFRRLLALAVRDDKHVAAKSVRYVLLELRARFCPRVAREQDGDA